MGSGDSRRIEGFLGYHGDRFEDATGGGLRVSEAQYTACDKRGHGTYEAAL